MSNAERDGGAGAALRHGKPFEHRRRAAAAPVRAPAVPLPGRQAEGDAVPAGMSQLNVLAAISEPVLLSCGLYSIFTVLKTNSTFCTTLPSSEPVFDTFVM